MTPQPYYEHDGIMLYHGDCRALLPDLGPLSAVGCVIADPPYGDTPLDWDRWPVGWVAAVEATVRESASLWCFGSMRMWLGHAGEFAAWSLAQDLVWEKHNGSGFAADRFKRVHEHVLHWYRGPWRDIYQEVPRVQRTGPNKSVRKRGATPHTGEIAQGHYEDDGHRLMRSVVFAHSDHSRSDHPTQKPQAILFPLLESSLAPGGIVLDPMAGAGSTLVAARAMGYGAIGIEAEERYCEAAAKRLGQEVLDFGGVA